MPREHEPTPAQIFDKVAAALHHLCSHEQEIIEVNIAAKKRLFRRTHSLSVVRHWRDPEQIFDRSRDRPVVLEPELRRLIDNYAKQFVRALRDLHSGTIRVYIDGSWSYGGSRQSAPEALEISLERTRKELGLNHQPSESLRPAQPFDGRNRGAAGKSSGSSAQGQSENTIGLSTAVRGILSVASQTAPPQSERAHLLDRVIESATRASPAELDESVELLIPALKAHDPYCGGLAAMAIGVLIESGASAAKASNALREALVRALKAATRFASTWKLGPPPATTQEFIEAFSALVNNELGVNGKALQAWAARDPVNARAWSQMDDWFLPIMALARFSEEGRKDILSDAELRSSCVELDAADPGMFMSIVSVANSQAGCHFKALIMDGEMPKFSDDVE